MNTKLIIWILGILLGAIVVAVLWYVLFAPKTPSQPAQQNPITLPTSGTTTPVTSGAQPQNSQMTIKTQEGTVVTNDFIHNGVTIPDTANGGNYLLAGNLEYCSSDPQRCQAGSAVDFNIFYDSVHQSFGVALLKEPLGPVRLQMETVFQHLLGITPAQMCSLDYYVGTTRYVNQQYSSGNLGFSFCPGATVLPQ